MPSAAEHDSLDFPSRSHTTASIDAADLPSLDILALDTPHVMRKTWLGQEASSEPARMTDEDMMDVNMDIDDKHGTKRDHSLGGNSTPDTVRHRSKKQK